MMNRDKRKRPDENIKVKCSRCHMEFPETKVLYDHPPPMCNGNMDCDHKPLCGLCIVLLAPEDAIINTKLLGL
jgi:hypothetical protein